MALAWACSCSSSRRWHGPLWFDGDSWAVYMWRRGCLTLDVLEEEVNRVGPIVFPRYPGLAIWQIKWLDRLVECT